MLDNLDGGDLDPKDLAKVRMAFKAKKQDPELADAVLEALGDPDAASRLAGSVGAIMALVSRELSDEEARDLLMQALQDPEATTPRKFEQVARDRFLEMRAEKDRALDGGRIAVGPATVGHSWEGGQGFRAKMVAGLSAKLNPADASPMGREAAGMTVAEIAMACARNAGLRPWNEVEAIRMAAHSTSDFPLILDGAMGNDVARRMAQREPQIARASRQITRQDYRSANLLSLSATAMPKEIKEGGEINHVTVEEKGEALPVLRDFGAGFNITNQALANDATAVRLLGDIANRMAQGAVERKRAVLLEPLLANAGAGQTMSDGKAMFHADHGNLAASAAALSVTSLNLARVAMRRTKGMMGELLAVEPWALLVPPEQETLAQQVMQQIAATKISDTNPFAGTLEIIVEAGLTSTTAWYVLADPAAYDGLTHAVMDGLNAPRIESREAWETLGMQFRLVWALDAKFVETATWYRNAGA